jgi:hypothetical protein
MKPIEIIATDLFDKVRSRFTNLQMGDESGSVTADPAAARFFDFDFAIENVILGRVSISINEIGNLKIFYSQGITENADLATQTMWYDFLKEMRYFAKRRLLSFDTRDITKGNLDKTDFQYLAQNGLKDNNMNESAMFGSTKTSHRKIEDTDLIIRHSEAIDPTKPGARSRKIKNLFIQNKEGERFKFPFIYLPGARAMQRHVANGGYPHDEAGKHILKTCEEILKLSDFGRKVKHATLNDNAHGIIERAGQKLKSLRHHLESMCKQGYYESWKESYAPTSDNSSIELDDATLEGYKDTFTQTKFDEALAEVFPLLHAIMQEASEVDLDAIVSESQDEEIHIEETEIDSNEFAAFESWTESIIGEGFSDEELAELEQLVQEPFPIGANDEAVQALAGIGIKDPALIKALRAQASMPNGENIDARETIKTFLGSDAEKISFGDLDVAPVPVQPPVQEDGDDVVTLNGKEINTRSIEVDGVESYDRPDFSDAYISYAEFTDGTPLSDEELDQLTDEQGDLVNMAAHDSFHESTNNESANKVDIPAYKRKQQGGDWKVTQKDLDKDREKNISDPKTLAKNSGVSEDEGDRKHNQDLLRSWMDAVGDKIKAGKFKDWIEVSSDLQSHMQDNFGDISDQTADRIAQRLFGHDSLAQYRVAPQGDLEKDIPKDDGDDDDSAFLNKLRGQARSGSIKQGADTGEKDESAGEEVDPDSENPLKKVAKLVSGFYNREDGTWTKGEQGVITHVKRQCSNDAGEGGEKEAMLAAKLIKHLNDSYQSEQQFEDIKKLAGLSKI